MGNIKLFFIAEIRSLTTPIRVGILFVFCLLQAACVPSEDPRSTELVQTVPPTYTGGLSSPYYTTVTSVYTLSGECDPISKGLEWSYDNVTWTAIPGGCVASAFTFNITVNKVRKAYVRALTKWGWTSPSVATVRLLLPPTSPAMQFVTAGSSIDSDVLGMNFNMSASVQGQVVTTPAYRLNSNVTGIVYGQ